MFFKNIKIFAYIKCIYINYNNYYVKKYINRDNYHVKI